MEQKYIEVKANKNLSKKIKIIITNHRKKKQKNNGKKYSNHIESHKKYNQIKRLIKVNLKKKLKFKINNFLYNNQPL